MLTPRKLVEPFDEISDGFKTPESKGSNKFPISRHESFFKRPDKNGSNCMCSSEKRNYWEIIQQEQINFRLDFTKDEEERLRLFPTAEFHDKFSTCSEELPNVRMMNGLLATFSPELTLRRRNSVPRQSLPASLWRIALIMAEDNDTRHVRSKQFFAV